MVTMNHDYSKGGMKALGAAFMILPIVFVCLRLWAKFLSAKRLALDDYLTIGALLVSVTCCALQIATAEHGHLGSHQPVNPDGTAIMDDPGLIFFEQTKFAINCVSILGLGLVKCSILVLYRNIFNVQKFKIAIYVCLAYVIGWTISFFFSHLLTCVPITVFIEPYYGNKCVQTVPMFLALLYTDVFADWVIFLLPIPMVLSVQLQMRQKLAVIGMFMLGAAVCAISVTRVIATYAIAEEYVKHPNDVIYYTAPVFFWTNIELSLAVVCACLPTLRPIYIHYFRPATLKSGSYPSGYGSSSLPGSKHLSSNPKRSRKPYEEIDELELTQHPAHSDASHGSGSRRLSNGVIKKQVTIQQSTERTSSDEERSLHGWRATAQ